MGNIGLGDAPRRIDPGQADGLCEGRQDAAPPPMHLMWSSTALDS